MAQFRSKPFGVTKNGDKVDEYIISNPGGLEISVLNYGCVIKNLFVPTKTGPVDVVVGHDTLAVLTGVRVLAEKRQCIHDEARVAKAALLCALVSDE